MDGQGQAPAPTLALDQSTLKATTTHASTTPSAMPASSNGHPAAVSSTPAPLLTDLASSTDRPNGSNGPENAAESEPVKEALTLDLPVETAPITNGAPLPQDSQAPPLSLAAPITLNANVVNAAGEAEHAARVEEQANIESAILKADAVKQEQPDDAHRQRTPLIDPALREPDAATIAGSTDRPRSPVSPSSTSALSSVTASAAPSVAHPTPSNQSVKDAKEDDETSESGQQVTDSKPRSSGGRSTARRAASNASLRDTAAATSSTATRRSEKPPSTSSASGTNGSRTRGTSAQGQPQRQSSRSKTTTSTSTSSNTRPRMRQRGTPDTKEGNDATSGTRRSRRTRQAAAQNGRGNGEEDESDDGDEGVTRCVCGNNDDETLAFMIQCDTCKAWQHGPCVGFKYENDCPDTYYCEQCRPELHPNLLSRGKKHARSFSASGRAHSNGVTPSVNPKDETDELGRSTSSNKPTSRDYRELSTTSLPASGTAAISSGHPSYHRARSSADAAIISTFLDTSQHSPQPPDSPGSPGGSSEGGTRRPMYPPTSHFAAPQNPKRRSTMNSRDSAAFDESILLATQQAFRESRAMAMDGSKGRKRKKRDDDDDMEPVKEEEEYSDEDESQQHSEQRQDRAESHTDSARDNSHIEPTLASHEDEGEGEGDEDGDEHDETSVDANGLTAPRKRRRRRGAGALFTAPNKKRAASSRTKKPTSGEAEPELHEELSVNGVQYDVSPSATEDEVNARKRKRDEANADDERLGRAPSPTASHDTSASSQELSEKPLAQGNKRRKGSPPAENGANGTEAPPTQIVSNILGSTLQIAIPTAPADDSAAPSPAASMAPGQTDTEQSSKEQETHADAVTNGLLAVVDAKRGVDTDQEDSTPAPTTQVEDSAAATAANVNGKGIKQPNQYTYKRGGPGSRGGLKGSPSKRAALAAAAEARHGKHRDETPSTYEDWINQPPGWGLPDHLSHLSHLLPGQSPLPLQVTKFVTSPSNSAVASPVAQQGEAVAESTQNGDSTPSTPAITVSSSLEPSAKIRFPSRRMSIAEMRKRAKSMLDYLARVQVDTIDRNNRNRALAAVQETILTNGHSLEEEVITPPPSMLFKKDSPLTPQATNLIDDLSRQLNSFQEKFL